MSKFYKYFLCRILFAFSFLFLSVNLVLAENEKLSVFVSILPQKFFAERLLGENGTVEVLIGAGQSPHTYEPLPQQMGKLSRSNMFFTVGIPFERSLIGKLSSLCPNLKIVATDANIEKLVMLDHEHHEHMHSNMQECHEDEKHVEGEHHHNNNHHEVGLDPHFWLDPERASIMADNMAKAIVEAKPELSAFVESNLNKIKVELKDLSDELSQKLIPFKGQTMLVFHPAFGYFATRFGLIQKAVEIEGKEPAPRQLANLIKICKTEGIKVIFVQKQFPANTAETIASSIGGKVLAIDPLAEDYINNLKAMGEAVAGSAN